MSEWVIFAEARGKSGAVKMAWQSADEPGPNELQAARGIVSGQYRRLYQEWPGNPESFKRDDAGRARPAFPRGADD